MAMARKRFVGNKRDIHCHQSMMCECPLFYCAQSLYMNEDRLVGLHTGNFLVHDRRNLGAEELNGTEGFSVWQ